ncbi:MAG: Eco29kI family restriction endonuclease [Planctomycetota bacterium]|nr:Eco29kI family restriction endonuclease [Planctomycetota bacterium]
MSDESPYNPLDKRNLGASVAKAILDRPVVSMPLPEVVLGAGVYAIYYTGRFPLYQRIAERNRDGQFSWPIYVGKAIPKGGRRGVALEGVPGRSLFNRLSKHASSIEQASNLDIADFYCRYLVLDDIWIPLGETLLINLFVPIWNTSLDGFGNNTPGEGRIGQMRSQWDVIHPGRSFAKRLSDNKQSAEKIIEGLKAAIDKIP